MTDMQLLTYEPSPAARPVVPRSHAPAFIELPEPDLGAGLPLMSALSMRASTREFSDEALLPATLGALLWAANGVNRPATGGRTAPMLAGLILAGIACLLFPDEVDADGVAVALLVTGPGDTTWRRPVSLTVLPDAPIGETLKRALLRPAEHRHDPVLWTDEDGRPLGVVHVAELTRAVR